MYYIVCTNIPLFVSFLDSSDSLGIVCPLSSYGPVHQLLKPVITIGSGNSHLINIIISHF